MSGRITIQADRTKVLRIRVKDTTGGYLDLSGVDEIVWWLAPTPKSADADVLIRKDLEDGITVGSDATGSYADVTIDPDDTEGLEGRYYHETKVVDDSVPVTVDRGEIRVEPSLIPDPTPD